MIVLCLENWVYGLVGDEVVEGELVPGRPFLQTRLKAKQAQKIQKLTFLFFLPALHLLEEGAEEEGQIPVLEMTVRF